MFLRFLNANETLHAQPTPFSLTAITAFLPPYNSHHPHQQIAVVRLTVMRVLLSLRTPTKYSDFPLIPVRLNEW